MPVRSSLALGLVLTVVAVTDAAVAAEPAIDWREISPSEAAPFLGYYRQGSELVQFTFKGGRLYATGTGQPEIELRERQDGLFEGPSSKGNWQFQVDKEGRTTAAVLLRNGKSEVLPRVGTEEVARIQAAEAENLQRKTPHDGSEARLRRQISAFSAGMPAYDELGENLARSIREAFPKVKMMLDERGGLRALTFRQSLANGADVFWVDYEHGRLEWVISQPDQNGKIQHLAFRPL